MPSTTRTEVFERIEGQLRAELHRIGLTDQLEVDVFFADELLFASVTIRGDQNAVVWRSSHAATPNSGQLRDLETAGEDLIDRIVVDGRQRVEGTAGADQ